MHSFDACSNQPVASGNLRLSGLNRNPGIPKKTIGLSTFMTLFLLFPVLGVCNTTPHEPNNSLADATLISVNGGQKTYKFDYSGDEDWFKFYVLKGSNYNIQIPDLSVAKGINPVIEIFNEQGGREIVSDINFTGEGELLPLKNVPKDGFYYLRITNQQKTFSTDGHYDLKVYLPELASNLSVAGKVIDSCTKAPLVGANIDLPNKNINTAAGLFNYPFAVNNGKATYTLVANADGYHSQSITVSLDEQDPEKYVNQWVTFALSPISGCQAFVPPTPPLPNPVATFNDQTGELLISDVRVGDNRFSAKLQLRGNFKFELVDIKPNSILVNTPAYYDFENALVNIPSVFAYGKTWRIQMQNSPGNDTIYGLAGSAVELP